MKNSTYISWILVLLPLFFCGCKEDMTPQDKTPDSGQGLFYFSTKNVSGISSGIRVFAFDKDDHFWLENPTVPLADTAIYQSITLPLGEDKLVLLANAGAKGTQAPIVTPLSPHMASLSDVMLRLNDNGSGLEQPVKYFYGLKVFQLVAGPDQKIQVEMKNLCSKVEAIFTNGVENTIDSVRMSIENAGKDILFNGTVSAVGTTLPHTFRKGTNQLVASDTFLLFPSKAGVPPVVHATFYLHNGHTRIFQKELSYAFVSNKVLRFTFDLQDVEDQIDLTVQTTDWEGTHTQTVQSNLTMTLNGGNPANYTMADITLQYNFSPSTVYPIIFRQLALTPDGSGGLKLAVPLSNLEQGKYRVTDITLYDVEGSFPALKDTVDFDMGFDLNNIPANVYGRPQYENLLLKKWLKVVDGNGGQTFPGTTLIGQINGNPSFDLTTSLPTLGITQTTVRGEARISAWNLPSATASLLAHFIVPAEIKAMKQLTTLALPTCLVRDIDLRNLPSLTSLTLAGNTMTDINVSGCKGLTSFSSGFTAQDFAALTTLNCSYTGITTLSASLVNLTSLTWTNSNLSLANVQVIKGYTKLTLLDISANLLTDYPDFSGLLLLTTYRVSGNNIISCALAYMHKFGADNILPQRTGNNWWCP